MRRSDSVLGPLVLFAVLGLIALVVVGVTGIVVVRRLATDQALAEARQLTEISARLIERRVDEGLITGDAKSLAAMASAVSTAVTFEGSRVVRVKIWTREGEILYSDETELIGARFPLDEEDLEILDAGGVASEVSDLSEPENRYERSFGELLEVYTWIRTPGGTPLLFETYQRTSTIDERQQELQRTFAPVLLATLVVLAILEVPIAWILARRVRSAQRERERLLQGAIDATELERRRIAGDLHDGPVQELAGLSMRLSAAAEGVADRPADVLRDAASGVRASVRTLRSAIVGVYPPNVRTVGLRAALSDLVSGVELRGLETSLEVGPDVETAAEEALTLVYRAAQESLRNAEEHADAQRVDIAVRRAGDRIVLTVADDGVGIEDGRLDTARDEGHVGLAILTDLARSAGGDLRVSRGERGGTVVTMEVPAT